MSTTEDTQLFYLFKRKRDHDGFSFFSYTEKIDNEILELRFYRYVSHAFYVEMCFGVKRKNRDKALTSLQSTGRSGIKGLLAAKKALRLFIQFINLENYNFSTPIDIIVGWEDNRRRDVYEYGLRDLGFTYSTFYGTKVLKLTIPAQEVD